MIRFFRTAWRDFWAHAQASYEKERDGAVGSITVHPFPVTPYAGEVAIVPIHADARTRALVEGHQRAEALRALHEAEQRWGISPRKH
jgi:hypothetical protein